MPTKKILRKKDVREKTGYSNSTIDRKEKAGEFPKRVQLGPNSVGWWEHEVEEHMDKLPRGFHQPKICVA